MDAHQVPPAAPVSNRMHWRRIPGTLVLAITNFIASTIALSPDVFEHTPVLFYVGRIANSIIWGSLFLLSAIFLTLGALTRRWLPFNIGAAMSLGIWTAIGAAILLSGITGTAEFSVIATAIVFWIVGGQATMLVVPLVSRGRWVA